MMSSTLYIILLGMLSFVLFMVLFFLWMFFGKIIKLQLKRWAFGKRGYVEIAHVGETGIEDTFLMKPKEYKFDFKGGFYHYIPEALTKGGDLLKFYPEELLKSDVPDEKVFLFFKKDTSKMSVDEQQNFLRKFRIEANQARLLAAKIANLKFDPEAVVYKFGMPKIYYYGDHPDPILFRDRKKIFGSGIIRDMYLKILLTQRYKDFMKFILWGLIVCTLFGVAFSFALGWGNNSSHALVVCQDNLNRTTNFMQYYLNETIKVTVQNSTLVI